jgi:hypothetical protein
MHTTHDTTSTYPDLPVPRGFIADDWQDDVRCRTGFSSAGSARSMALTS